MHIPCNFFLMAHLRSFINKLRCIYMAINDDAIIQEAMLKLLMAPSDEAVGEKGRD